MAKIRLTSPTFNAAAKTVTHASFSDVTLAGIQLIVNVTDQVIIYNFADTAKGGALAGDVLTLEFNTTTMSDTDELMVLVEDGVSYQLPTGAATAANQASILAAVDGIEALLGTIDADTGAILLAVDTLETLVASTNTKLDTLIAQTDGVEATLTAIEGDTSAIQTAVDGIETLIGTTNTTLTTIDGRVDGLEASNSAIQTAVELLDDTVATLGTTTYTEATNKAVTIGAVRRDANTTLVSATNEIAPLQVNATGELKVAQIAALPTGANVIGGVTMAANATTSPAKARDVAAGANDTGIPAQFIRRDAPTAVTPIAGDYEFAQITNLGAQYVAPVAHTAGGWTPHMAISAASTNATSLKSSAGQVGGFQVFNLNAAARYLKFYNKASSPTVGTDTPVKVIMIPGNTAGAGAIMGSLAGVEFTTGIAYALTTGIANSDTGAVAASEIAVNIDWK